MQWPPTPEQIEAALIEASRRRKWWMRYYSVATAALAILLKQYLADSATVVQE